MQQKTTEVVVSGGRKSLGLAVILCGCLTFVMITAMRGSAWPTSFFVIGGFALPYLIGLALYWSGRRRFVRLLSVVVALAGLWVVMWIGKHPSAERAFREVTGVEMPAGAEVICVERGWFDGRTTIVRFRTDVASVRAAMQACDAGMDSVDKRVVDESMKTADRVSFRDRWKAEISWAIPIASWMADPPAWSQPRYSHWSLWRTPKGGHRDVWFFWDDATGEAIAYDGED